MFRNLLFLLTLIIILSFTNIILSEEINDLEVYSDFILFSTWERANLKGLDNKTTYVIYQDTYLRDFESLTTSFNIKENRDEHITLFEYLKGQFPGEDEELLKSFALNNKESTKIPNNFLSEENVKVITEEEFISIFSKGWWPDFYSVYPDAQGILRFSRVGFNKSGTRALLYIRNQWQGRAGLGGFVILVHNGSKWLVEEKVAVILS